MAQQNRTYKEKSTQRLSYATLANDSSTPAIQLRLPTKGYYKGISRTVRNVVTAAPSPKRALS